MNREHVAGVLDAIDHAIEDWQVSHDAMRWTPEAPGGGTSQPTGHVTWTPTHDPIGAWRTAAERTRSEAGFIATDGTWQPIGYVTADGLNVTWTEVNEVVEGWGATYPILTSWPMSFEVEMVNPGALDIMWRLTNESWEQLITELDRQVTEALAPPPPTYDLESRTNRSASALPHEARWDRQYRPEVGVEDHAELGAAVAARLAEGAAR